MELRHLRYFVAVAEQLHFRHAAELVCVAQPALSLQIQQLEKEIGVTLFIRSHHKVQLTPAGKAFYEKAQSILRQTGQAAAEARKVELGEAGTIRVGFVSTAAITVLPGVMKALKAQVPSADIELRELAPGEQIDSLYREQLDLGFVHAKLTHDLLETLTVQHEKLILAMPEALAPEGEPRVDLRKIAGLTAIMPARHTGTGLYEQVMNAYRMSGVVPEHVHYTRLLQTTLLLVGAGIGVSIVPESFRAIHVEGVVYRGLQVEPPPCELTAAWRRDNESPLLRRFVQELRRRSAPKPNEPGRCLASKAKTAAKGRRSFCASSG